MTIRVGFAGAGHVARLHAQAIQDSDGIELVTVASSNHHSAADFANAFGIAADVTYAEMLHREDIDAIYVLTPTHTHAEIAIMAIQAGKHVLVEKPVSHEPAQILNLIEAAKEHGIVAFPGHNYLYLPETTRLVRQMKQNELGIPRALFVNYAIAHDQNLQKIYSGALREIMVHHCYIALSLLGVPDRFIGSVLSSEGADKDDLAWMTWEYNSGATAHLFATFAVDDFSYDPLTFSIKVLGTEGSTGFSWRAVSTKNGPFTFGIPLYEETYRHETIAFREAIVSGRPPLSDLEAAYTASRIISSIENRMSDPHLFESIKPLE